MTQPNTPAGAIATSAARLKAASDANRELARRLAQERQAASEGELPATGTPQP